MTMESYEVSYMHFFKYDSGRVSNQLVYFENRADDIFQETSTIGGGSEFRNAGERKVQGLENSLKISWEEFNVLMNLSWEQPKDNNLASDSLNIPKIKANVLLDYTFSNKITVALMNHYVSEVKTNALDITGNSAVEKIDGFVETDITLSRRDLVIDKNAAMGIELSILNVFDVDFYHPQVRDSSPLQYKQNGRSFNMKVTMDY